MALGLMVVAIPTARGVVPEGPATETPASPTAASLTPAESRLKADVSFLAADAREGRAPGTKGIEASAEYIAEAFKQLGLKPAPGADGYFQKFTVRGRPRLGEPLELVVAGPGGQGPQGRAEDRFLPPGAGIERFGGRLPIVFAGYGITAKDSALKLDYDDYAGVDVHGKAVLIIRHEPQQDREDSPFAGKKLSDYATFRHKATNAFQHGAAVVLLVNDLAGLGGDKDRVLGLVNGGADAITKLPFVMVTREFADKVLAAAGEPGLAELEKQIDRDLEPRSRALKGVELTAKLTIDRPAIETKNVIGVLEGSGPLAEQTVIVGGHYDHLGRGGLTSGSLAFLSSEIHNGADDNASGTSMMLEMARRLAARRDPLPRRVVFMAFSGEERGLLGSKHYVDHPLYPLSSTVMMVNFDMVGRLNGKNELTMIGTGSSPGLDVLVDALGKTSGLAIKKVSGLHRRVRRQRPRVVLPEGHPDPVRVHGHSPRLSPAQRRLRSDQLRRHGPHRRLSRADPARPGPQARSSRVHQAGPAEPRRPAVAVGLGRPGREPGRDARLLRRVEERHEDLGREGRRPGGQGRAQGGRLDREDRRQGRRDHLRLHGKPEGLQARRQGRGGRDPRRQGSEAPGRARRLGGSPAQLTERRQRPAVIQLMTLHAHGPRTSVRLEADSGGLGRGPLHARRGAGGSATPDSRGRRVPGSSRGPVSDRHRPTLRIATPWPRRERQELETEYHNRTGSTGPIRLVWIEVPPGDRSSGSARAPGRRHRARRSAHRVRSPGAGGKLEPFRAKESRSGSSLVGR